MENGKWKMEKWKMENGWKMDNRYRKKLMRFCYHIRHGIHINVSIRILQTHITVDWVYHESMYCDIHTLSVYNTLSNATKDET